jgi:23S rRNA pseudouridine955/2504/2580 synthase
MKEYTIGKNDAGQRLDRFLTKQGLTVGVIRKALRKKDIKVRSKSGDGFKRELADYKLAENDVLRVYLPIEDESKPKPKFYGVSTTLNIVHEDADILLADKPVGLLCQPDSRAGQDCLINRIKAYLYKNGEWNPEDENAFEPALCNRIDRNTAGIVIAAKNAESLRVLNEKIKAREITKLYLCILCGIPEKKAATMTAFLEKDEAANTVKIRDYKTPNAKTIVTKYRVLETRGNFALAEVNLLTGRTHQIRAHMAHIGCPLLGDGKYGRNALNREFKRHGFSNKQALCSYKLVLDEKTYEVEHVWFLDAFREL